MTARDRRASARDALPLPPGVVWNGNRDLVPLLEPLVDLVPDAENARMHPEPNLAGIRQSLGMLSQYKPLTGWRPAPGAKIVILAGNGTLESIRAIGWTHAAVTVFEGRPHEARTLAIIDNKTAESSTWNEELVARQIEECTTAWAEEAAVGAEEAAPVVEEVAPRTASPALSSGGLGGPARAEARPQPAGPLTFARALAIKIAEIPPGPHRVGLIDTAIRRVFERAAKVADGWCDHGDACAKAIRTLPEEVVE